MAEPVVSFCWVGPVPYLKLLWLNQLFFLHWVEPVPYFQGRTSQKMPKIDTLDALEEQEEHDDDYQTITN